MEFYFIRSLFSKGFHKKVPQLHISILKWNNDIENHYNILFKKHI